MYVAIQLILSPNFFSFLVFLLFLLYFLFFPVFRWVMTVTPRLTSVPHLIIPLFLYVDHHQSSLGMEI